MDYEPYDSSGTDDDFPPSHQNRIPRGGAVANGRNAAMGPVSYPRTYVETDMEAQIHHLEKEAYSSVLRAFKAQSDAISWEKEGLITELRKELRLSNEEHRELLGRVNADDLIRRIREWRQTGGHQFGVPSSGNAVHDQLPSPSISASRKKQKTIQPGQPQSFGEPTPAFRPPMVTASTASKQGSMSGAKGRKHKPSQMFPGSALVKRQYPSSGPVGRGKYGNPSSGPLAFEPSEAAAFDPLVGRKVRTRWPDDDNFYEAVITDYNPAEGRHALVYDIGTTNETWEWVNLAEISPKDIQWVGEAPQGFNQGGGHGGPGHGMNRSAGNDTSRPVRARGRASGKGQSRKDFPSSQNGIGKKGSDAIQLLHTDTLVKEVERIVDANHPDPLEIEKAKKMLKEHEQALTEAIAKLADISDGESDEGARFLQGQPMDR